MKANGILFTLLVMTMPSLAQEGNYLWPIKGAAAGTEIICAPQGYIDQELNFANLFIGAQEGDTVVSPVSGSIQDCLVGYKTTLRTGVGWSYPGLSFNESRQGINHTLPTNIGMKNVGGKMAIGVGGGVVVHIDGLTGDHVFKTGQRIKKGDPIGLVGHSYYKIKQPSIAIAVSRNQKVADPMTPFGIPSSFIPPRVKPPVTSVTNAQAKADFLIYTEALKELFPSLYNVITPQELERYIDQTVAEIAAHKGNWTIDEFREIMRGAVAKVHDSHIYMYPSAVMPQATEPQYKPRLIFGWIGDTLLCTNAVVEHKQLIGKPVSSVNGMSADSMKKRLIQRIGGYDQKAGQYVKYILATEGITALLEKPIGDGTFDLSVEFADGEQVELKGCNTNESVLRYQHTDTFYQINTRTGSFAPRVLNDSIAYMGFAYLSADQTTQDNIAAFLQRIADTKHLIIDLRNNDGGQAEALYKIYSFIAREPVIVSEYQKVNKNRNIKSLNYSTNFSGITSLFTEYQPIAGRTGLYNPNGEGIKVEPDSTVNFRGKVYVLVNERSASAATLLPAMLYREKRGMVIGRETRTGYHYMTAEKFAEILLPNSEIKIKFPLIELGFDTEITDRMPDGCGMIPDRIVPLTLDELNFVNGDAILNYTIDLITNNQSTDTPGEELASPKSSKVLWIIIFSTVVVVAVVAIYVVKKKRNARINKQ